MLGVVAFPELLVTGGVVMLLQLREEEPLTENCLRKQLKNDVGVMKCETSQKINTCKISRKGSPSVLSKNQLDTHNAADRPAVTIDRSKLHK